MTAILFIFLERYGLAILSLPLPFYYLLYFLLETHKVAILSQ